MDIEWMIHNGVKRTLHIGDPLITKGETVDYIYIILSGQLSIFDVKKDIATIGPGEVVGEMSYLESRPPSVSVTAIESSEIYCIPRTIMNEKLDKDVAFRANFYYALALFLSDRLRKTTDQLEFGAPEETDLIDDNVLSGVAQAGARFNTILQKFSEA